MECSQADQNESCRSSTTTTSDGTTTDEESDAETDVDADNVETEITVTQKPPYLFIVTKKGMCIRFGVEALREIGRTARGVTGIRFKEPNDCVVGAAVIYNDQEDLLS